MALGRPSTGRDPLEALADQLRAANMLHLADLTYDQEKRFDYIDDAKRIIYPDGMPDRRARPDMPSEMLRFPDATASKE